MDSQYLVTPLGKIPPRQRTPLSLNDGQERDTCLLSRRQIAFAVAEKETVIVLKAVSLKQPGPAIPPSADLHRLL